MSGFYNNFTIEDAGNIGASFKAICKSNSSYERQLTKGKSYIITITTRILTMSPLCKVLGDNGKMVECHLERFTKEEDL